MMKPMLGCLALFLWFAACTPGELRAADIPFEGTQPAQEFPPELEWLNTDKPLTLAGLKGKLVLLDFWTYCCINCMHVIPDLKKLESKYARELVVIGVHSAKFTNEKQTDNIRQAIKRYEIEHPVVNDRDFAVWRLYGARSWPTLVLINPNGQVIGYHSGEGVFELFDKIIGDTVRHFDAKKEIDRRAVEFALEKHRSPRTLFSYPGKIVADEKTGRIFFSDSNNNRLIVASAEGHILDVIGGDTPGFTDGDYRAARFFRPQGLCFEAESNTLYVADTENHAIRKVDLGPKKVATVAGLGIQARERNAEGRARVTALNSPWDLVLVSNVLYVAMAGPHQLWTIDLKTLEAKVHAGSGRENITDGPLKQAALAQPSGLTFDGDKLYFADSEVSAIRSAQLSSTGRVETLVGKGLFDFGDVDGKFPDARLQHCIGLTAHEGMLYVADTYNHKIRKLDPQTREVTTLIGTGRPGAVDGDRLKAQLNEPNGLCFVRGKLLIADSNNHLIRSYDPGSGKVSTLVFKGYERLPRATTNSHAGERILMKPVRLSPQAKELKLELTLPSGTKLNPLAPSNLRVSAADSKLVTLREATREITGLQTELPLSATAGQTTLTIDLDVYYCSKGNEGLCYFKSARLVVPLEVAEGGPVNPTVGFQIKL